MNGSMLMRRWSTKFTVAALALAIPATSFAQEFTPERMQNVTVHEVILFDLKPGKAEEWDKMVTDHIRAANQAAGGPPFAVHHVMTSDWDRMVIIALPDGMASLDWETSPMEARFNNALQQRLGSRQKFQEFWARLSSLVEDDTSFYTHVHQGGQ